MKALVFDGDLSIREVPEPEPTGSEVLIRIVYSAICNTDLEIIKGYMGFKGIPGHEFVGSVVSPGSPLYGKLVVGEINCPCGHCYLCKTGRPTHCGNRSVLGISGHPGIFAEFVVLPAENLHVLPENLDPVVAVFTEPLAAAIEIFDQIHIKPAEEAFIFGAGKLGLLISMVFKLGGTSYKTFDLQDIKILKGREMGLNIHQVSSLPETQRAEVCIDCTGSAEGIKLALAHLQPRGRLILKTTVAKTGPIDLNAIVINEFSIIGSRCGPFQPALNLLADGLINPRPLISQTYNFEDIIDAFEHAAKPGTMKVLIRH